MDGTEDKFAEIGEALLKLNEQLIGVAGDFVKLRHTVIALESIVAARIFPGDPKAALERIRQLEAEIAKKDPSAKLHQEVSEMAEAVRLMEKHGGPKHS
ncbi:MAG: hypothetical protein WBQ09_09560 [Terriglobales bacterium]